MGCVAALLLLPLRLVTLFLFEICNIELFAGICCNLGPGVGGGDGGGGVGWGGGGGGQVLDRDVMHLPSTRNATRVKKKGKGGGGGGGGSKLCI